MSQGQKPALQKRSRETRDKLLISIENLIKKKTFEEISIADIAKGAGVSPASIYRRFKNKDAFLPVLFEIYLKRIEEWSQSPEARLNIENITSLREALFEAAKVAWIQMTQQSHILKVLISYLRLKPELIGDDLRQWEEQSLMSFKAIINFYQNEVKRSDLEKASSMVTFFFNTIFLDYGLFEGDSERFDLNLSGDQFAREVADMAFGYLMIED